jgi:hypothetical protein
MMHGFINDMKHEYLLKSKLYDLYKLQIGTGVNSIFSYGLRTLEQHQFFISPAYVFLSFQLGDV